MSLFNPWVLLTLALTLVGTFFTGYQKGAHAEHEKQQLEIARLNEQARVKEQALVGAVQKTATKLVEANNAAKLAQQKRNSAIDSGAIKLRVPVKTVCPTVQTTDNPAPTSGDNSGSAELQPTVARDILAIGDDADHTARKLAACIQAYNQAREMINGGNK